MTHDGMDLTGLGADDARVLDALVDGGFEAERVAPDLRDRARRLASVLGLLDVDAALPPERLAEICERIESRAAVMRADPTPVLLPDDQEALDAWVIAGYEVSRVPASLRERARRIAGLGALICQETTGASDDLVDRTMAKVGLAMAAERDRLLVTEIRANRWRGVRLSDVVSVAAMLLLGVSVLWPTLSFARDRSRKLACQGNMQAAGVAFGQYAYENRDQLPVATASLGGGSRWWEVRPDEPRANSSNLFELVREGYAPISSLACPGNEHAAREAPEPGARDWRRLEEVSYSYQIMFGNARPSWGGNARTAVMSDRSPVVLQAIRRQPFDPNAQSPNHHGRGQCVLFNDGTMVWLSGSELPNGDNIWLPRPIEDQLRRNLARPRLAPLDGQEVPADAGDAFVGP